MLLATQRNAVATIAGAMITVSGRPWSIKEVMELMNSLHFALHPSPGAGRYDAWAKDPQNLEKVYK